MLQSPGDGVGEPPEARLAAFMAKYEPTISELARGIRGRVRELVPGGFELVYDNYNGLVLGYGPSEKGGEAVLSIALYPEWVRLFFLDGAELADPGHLLEGEGRKVRSLVVDAVERLDEPEVLDLIRRALERAVPPFPTSGPLRLIVKSVSARQRPRRRA